MGGRPWFEKHCDLEILLDKYISKNRYSRYFSGQWQYQVRPIDLVFLRKKHHEEDHWVCHMNHLFIWMFPKIAGFSPQILHGLIGFSMIFTIHYGGKLPIFGNTHMKSLAVWPGEKNLQVMTMPLVWQLGCQDSGEKFGDGFQDDFFCLHMDDWGAWQLKYFCYFSPRKFGEDSPIWRTYFSKGLVQPPIRWVWMIFLWQLRGSGLGRWIFEGSRKDLIKLLLISLSLKWKRKPHKQVLCVWVWCLYWCPAILQWGCLTPGGFFH